MSMELKTSDLKVLEYFFENSYEQIYLRELSRKTKLSVFTVKKTVDKLVHEGILIEEVKGKMRYVKVNQENLFFRFLKISFNIKKILDSGTVEYLKENIPALSSIVLFGSVARGEDDKKSDIDLLIIGQKPKRINLLKFERVLKRDINPIILKWPEWKRKAEKDKAFYIEIITSGIALYGNLPVIE